MHEVDVDLVELGEDLLPEALAEGDELALIPPVAGGSVEDALAIPGQAHDEAARALFEQALRRCEVLFDGVDLLAAAPDKVLPLVYQFLGEPWFAGHDFKNLTFDAPEFDAALGLSGLHKVRPQVAVQPRHTVLPPA